MRKVASILLVLGVIASVGLVTAPASRAHGALLADYRFVDSLTSSVPGAPALELIGTGTSFATEQPSGANDRVLVFPAGAGLRLPSASSVVGTSYTMVILFRSEYVPNEVDREAKIVDWHDGLSETGLSLDCYFMCNDNLQRPSWEGQTAGATIAPNTWKQLVIVRHASPSDTIDGIQVRTYVDGAHSAFIGLDDTRGVPQDCFARLGGCDGSLGNAVRFFVTDSLNTEPPIDQAGGAVARIRIYAGAMTGNEVSALARGDDATPSTTTSASPTPSPSGSTSPSPTPSPAATEPAGPKKVRVRTTTSFKHSTSPHQFFGVVKSKDKRCVKGRKVRVEDFNGGFSVGTPRAGRSGAWSVAHNKGPDDFAYLAIIDEKKIKTAKAIIICKGTVKGLTPSG